MACRRARRSPRTRRRPITALVLAVLAASCATGPVASAPPDLGGPVASPTDAAPSPPGDAPPTDGPGATDEPSAEPTPEEPALSEAELAELGVNEVGRVLVMEWHDVDDRDSRWTNSRETFRAQIAELYERGYRPVTTEEFIAGTFPIPEGTSPVLLTFDDSYRSHLWFGEDGAPHPDSVVGILEAFSREHPDWRATAAFYIYWPVPFRETERELIETKIRWLVDNGYEIGNHSYRHDDLSELDAAGVQETLALAQAEVAGIVPGYQLRSLSLPFGIWPQQRELAVRGSHGETSYEHGIVLLVGFMPTRSPHHAEYDPAQVQRVQAYVPEFRTWVDWLDAEPGRRFISDGDPDVVTFPTAFADVAQPLPGSSVRTYAPVSPEVEQED